MNYLDDKIKIRYIMEYMSIFNDVLGPVMRGPSSSHTAGSYRIARMAFSLMGERAASATFSFDPAGSYAHVYHQQGADLAFAASIMNWDITDERFSQALTIAAQQGLEINFKVTQLKGYDHPNTVKIELKSNKGKHLTMVARSIGGGMVEFVRFKEYPVMLTGKAHEILLEVQNAQKAKVLQKIHQISQDDFHLNTISQKNKTLLYWQQKVPLNAEKQTQLKNTSGVIGLWLSEPVFHIVQGEPLFSSAQEMVALAEKKELTLGQLSAKYEAQLLGISQKEAMLWMIKIYEIMTSSIDKGLQDENIKMQLLRPSAKSIMQKESKGQLAIGGLHTRAAARALAVMHVSNSMGVVCAAPTVGSAGVIPAVIASLVEKKNLSPEQAAMALFAAGGIGLVIARRATFAAEVAGCQVEIGAAAAMAAAAVVEAAGGKPSQAADAAAISLQNTMGSICDPVQGMCEIPCHTRNAAAASNAFVCADLILGGYENPIPLDETIDAVLSVGKMLPSELRCTAKGGLAICPSVSQNSILLR
jgi:L-serine dehydratase